MTWLNGLWLTIKGSAFAINAIKIGALILAGLTTVLIVLGKAKKAGKDQIRAENAEKITENVEKGNDAEAEVRRSYDRGTPLPERVRKHYID